MSEPRQETKEASPSFLEELAECWRKIPDKGFFFALLVVWAALFQFWGNAVFGWVETSSLFGWMYWVFDRNPDDAHGKLIPFVVLALFWWKRKELIEAPKGIWWPAFGLVAGALLLHVVGFMVQQTRLSIIGFFTGVYGLMGLVWGRHWLQRSFFPMILFVFCIPLGTVSESITYPLRMVVTYASVGIADTILGIPVIREGSLIFDPKGTFRYDVAPACSGIRSLISLLALTTIYGFVTFNSTWKRLLMVVMAAPLAVLGNVIRITGVIAVGEAFGHDAGVFVEQKLGFITFAVAIVGIFLLGLILRESMQDRSVYAKAE